MLHPSSLKPFAAGLANGKWGKTPLEIDLLLVQQDSLADYWQPDSNIY